MTASAIIYPTIHPFYPPVDTRIDGVVTQYLKVAVVAEKQKSPLLWRQNIGRVSVSWSIDHNVYNNTSIPRPLPWLRHQMHLPTKKIKNIFFLKQSKCINSLASEYFVNFVYELIFLKLPHPRPQNTTKYRVK